MGTKLRRVGKFRRCRFSDGWESAVRKKDKKHPQKIMGSRFRYARAGGHNCMVIVTLSRIMKRYFFPKSVANNCTIDSDSCSWTSTTLSLDKPERRRVDGRGCVRRLVMPAGSRQLTSRQCFCYSGFSYIHTHNHIKQTGNIRIFSIHHA